MKLIDETKEKVKEVLEEYFQEKQGDYNYSGGLQSEVESLFNSKLERIFERLEDLDSEIDDLLDDNYIPSQYDQMCSYDTFRENQLAERR